MRQGFTAETPLYIVLCRVMKFWRDVQLVHALNDHAEIMTKHLTQRFADLRCQGPTPQSLTKLRLDYMERGFNVGSFVVML